MWVFKRPFIWIKRFRKRCGYGVHSPSAFDFITNVIYEKAAYYAYNAIETSRQYQDLKSKQLRHPPAKVNRLLFRLVNRFQPQLVMEVGPMSTSALYLKAAKRKAAYVSLSTQTENPGEISKQIAPDTVSLLFIHFGEHPEMVKRLIEYSFPRMNKNSICILEGIYRNRRMRKLWKETVNNRFSITTYDLYDVGIVLFDSDKIKQHYKVNF